jgi:hypothetical protein
VLCQARTGSCSLQIDADTKELLVFQRDAGHTAASLPASGGERCALTRAEMERYVRHYLARAGLSLPTGARHLPSPGTAVVYECAGISGGRSRLLQVRVNRTDASLEFLLNRPFQSSRRLNRG